MLASVGHCRGASEWVGDRLQEGLGKPDTFSHLPLLSVGLLSGRETLHSHGEPVYLKNPWAGAREVKVWRA